MAGRMGGTMTKTVFALYKDKILDRESVKVGEYETREEARRVWKLFLDDTPGDNVEMRIEQEERIIEENRTDLLLRNQISTLRQQLVELSTCISEQIILADGFIKRLSKIEEKLYND